MKKTWILIFILLFSGCTSSQRHKIVYPTDKPYINGNMYYERKEFDKAIELYKKFIEENPNAEFVIPAKLNLGMSYYYLDNFKKAYLVLKELQLEDTNIKTFVDNIIQTCKTQAPEEIASLEKPAAPSAGDDTKTPGGTIDIQITETYLDSIGRLILSGVLDKKASITIDETANVEANDNNEFSATVDWKKGRPIMITAKDSEGNAGKLKYFPDSEPPDEPRGLTISNTTSNSASLEWNENDEEDIKGYKLYFRLSGAGWEEVNEIIEDTDHEIVGLGNYVQGANKTFQFYLKAIDKMNNESDATDTIQTTLP